MPTASGRALRHQGLDAGPLIPHGHRAGGPDVEAYEGSSTATSTTTASPRWTDVLCLYTMRPPTPAPHGLADLFHGSARIFSSAASMPRPCPGALRHADQVLVGEARTTIARRRRGRIADPIVQCARARPRRGAWPTTRSSDAPSGGRHHDLARLPSRCTFCTTSECSRLSPSAASRASSPRSSTTREMGFGYMNFEGRQLHGRQGPRQEILPPHHRREPAVRGTPSSSAAPTWRTTPSFSTFSAAHSTGSSLASSRAQIQAALDGSTSIRAWMTSAIMGIACKEHGIQLIAASSSASTRTAPRTSRAPSSSRSPSTRAAAAIHLASRNARVRAVLQEDA